MRRIGHVLDAVAPASAAIRALHLGGGAMTLPRYVAATRPGSAQVVVEHDAELVATVLERLPLPADAQIDVLVADARSALGADGALAGAAPFDAVVVDLYARLEAPAFVDEPAFMGGCLAALAPGGLVVVNVADAPGSPASARRRAPSPGPTRARSCSSRAIRPCVSGADEGNAVLVAAPDGLPDGLADRLAAEGPFPAAVLTGHRLDVALWGAC